MRLLLDSHAAMWAFEEPDILPVRIRGLLLNESVSVFVSPVSAYELSYKAAIGKMRALPASFSQLASQAGFASVPVAMEHAELAAGFSSRHKDPWDRFIAAQAIREGLTVVTRDKEIAALGAAVLW